MPKDIGVPLRLAVANSKGGVGKTTTAVVLSEVLADAGPTLLVDADTQGSATAWHRYASAGDMSATLGTLSNVRDWSGSVVIDTAPGGPELAREAYGLVDLVIVPTSPMPADIVRCRPTLLAAAHVGTPAVVLLTMAPARSSDLRDARSVLDALDLPVLDSTVPRAVRIARCYGMAVPQLVRLDYLPVLAEVAALVVNTEGASNE